MTDHKRHIHSNIHPNRGEHSHANTLFLKTDCIVYVYTILFSLCRHWEMKYRTAYEFISQGYAIKREYVQKRKS